MDDDRKASGLSGLPKAMLDALSRELKRTQNLHELGFTQDEYGQWRAENCTVIIYPCWREYEIDITLPNGSAVGFDTPTLAGRLKDDA